MNSKQLSYWVFHHLFKIEKDLDFDVFMPQMVNIYQWIRMPRAQKHQ